MSATSFLLLTAVLTLSVQLTRWLPFLLFRKGLPKPLARLGKVLPAAMMGLLVVYCLKDYNFASVSGILPPLLSCLAVVVLHLWRHNMVLSIAAGTGIYMILMRVM